MNRARCEWNASVCPDHGGSEWIRPPGLRRSSNPATVRIEVVLHAGVPTFDFGATLRYTSRRTR